MRNKLLILTLVALTIIGVVIAQNQSLEEELASIEEELVNAGFDWLVNATIDENLDSSTIEVFTQNGNETLAVFEKINEEKFYKIYLTELNGTQDVFDLRINGSVEFDQILDPAPTMATVKINSTTNRSNESIKGYCKATDSDGDNLVYQYQWYNGSTVYFNGTLFKEGTISAGYYHTCGIRASDSRVLCWGDSEHGKLGDGQSSTDRTSPYLTTDSSAYLSVSARGAHTCGIRQSDRRVLCWGYSANGRLGDGQNGVDVLNPNFTTDYSAYSSISARQSHTCGIRQNDSRVLCWGQGQYGRLGDGSTSVHNVGNPNPTTDISPYISVSLGEYHTCGIRVNDSRVLCWGNGDYGQLGDGSTSAHSVSNPNVTTDSSSYSSMEVGYYHTCGIRVNDSRVLCWGNGTLGDGETTENVLNPNLTTDTSPYKKGFTQGEEVLVSILGNAYIKKGEIWKLGCRAYDFTTYSSWMNSTAMTILSSPPTMATVKINSTTNSSTENIKGYCNATDTDGDDLAYQYQWYNGSTVYFNGTLFKDGSISAGEFHTCGIRANDSRVLCWGDGDEGQLGDGSTAVHNNSNPNITTDSSAYSSVSAGSYHTCGIRQNDSRVLCWGRGNSGQLGDNGQIEKTNPTLTTDTSPYSSVSAGEDYTCGIRTNDSRVLCWGRSTEGQLGDGETTTRLVPTLTSDTSTYLRISAGEGTTCGIRANDSRVLCWGDGQYRSLGDGNTSLHNNLNPNLTTDTSAYSSVSVGGAHSCGIRANDSRVLCWGVGTYGRLGDGETTDNPNPNVTTDSFAYTKIIAGPFHTCGIRTNDSRVLCWGDGSYGTLGDGNTAAHNVANPNITTSSSPYKKGFSSSEEVLVSILGNAYLNVGENWSLGCRSYDFTDYSSWMNSSVLTI